MINKYTLFIEDEITNTWYDLDIDTVDFTTVFALDELQDISLRKDNYTKDLIINGTSKNNILLGRLYDISRHADNNLKQSTGFNFQANRYINCQLFENNIQLISGKLIVKNINVKNGVITYDCAILGNVFSFFNDIKDRELSDLDSIDDVITYNMATILDSWVSGDRYSFPTIDYGYDERPIIKDEEENEIIPDWYDNNYDFKNFRPAIYAKHYIDSIFRGWRLNESTNKYTQFDSSNNKLKKYSYSSEFINSNYFKSLIIPMNEMDFVKKVNGVWNTLSYPSSSFNTTLGRIRFFQSDGFNVGTSKYIKNVLVSGLHPDKQNPSMVQNDINVLVPLESNIKTSISITTSLTLKANMQGTFHVGLIDITALNYTGDPDTSTFVNTENMILKQTVSKSSSVDETYTINIINTEEVPLTGKYTFGVIKEGDVGINYSTTTININLGHPTTSTIIPVVESTTFKLLDSIPKNIKVGDFLKTIINMFNLYIIEDPNNPNKLIIEPYSTIFNKVLNKDFSGGVDWTNKLDSSNYKILTNIDLPTSYKFKFAEDDDMINEYYDTKLSSFGDRTINNINGLQEAKEIELIFAQTINAQTSKNDKNIPYIFKGEFFEGKKEPYTSKLRILHKNGTRISKEYQIHYRGVTVQSLSSYLQTSMIEKPISSQPIRSILTFGLPTEFLTSEIVTNDAYTLYHRFHNQQLLELNNSNLMLLEGDFLLNENDVSGLDFTTPIFIETQFGGCYWKLLELEYRNNYTTSKVKLQKIV